VRPFTRGKFLLRPCPTCFFSRMFCSSLSRLDCASHWLESLICILSTRLGMAFRHANPTYAAVRLSGPEKQTHIHVLQPRRAMQSMLSSIGLGFLAQLPLELVFSKEKTKAEFRSTTPCVHRNRGLVWLSLGSAILKPVAAVRYLTLMITMPVSNRTITPSFLTILGL
jgi:hypothetical protein